MRWPFLNCFVCLIFLIAFVTDPFAQRTDTSFKLLWFKGKKVNDSTLLTVSGSTVKYNPSSGKVDLNLGADKDILAPPRKEIARNEERKRSVDNLILKTAKGAPRLAFIASVNSGMDLACGTLEKLTESSIELVETNGSIEQQVTSSTMGESSEVPGYIQQCYDEVKAFIKRMQSIENPPTPPSAGLDYCYPCDRDRQNAYTRDSMLFMKYLAEEKNIFYKALAVIHYFNFRESKGLPYDKIRAGYMPDDMHEAAVKICERLEDKLTRAWVSYNKDATKITFLSQALLEQHRFELLLSLTPGNNFPDLSAIARQSIKASLNYLSDSRSKKDFKVLLNIKWIAGIFRTAAILGIEAEELELSILEFINYNRFRVDIDAYGKLNMEGNVHYARIRGENFFAAVPDKQCTLKWLLIGPDTTKMQFTLQDASLQMPEVQAEYTGTRNWRSNPADIRLDFCKPEKDTAVFFPFTPAPGEAETWMVKGTTTSVPVINNVYVSCFTDVKRLKAMAANPAYQAKLEQQMREKYKEFMAANVNKDPSKMTPADLEKMNAAMNASREIMNIVQTPIPYSFLVRGPLKNNTNVVFDQQLNGRELIPENKAIQDAIFRVKIEFVGE